MLLKSKICFTVFAIYEVIAISALHFQRICDAMFGVPFCNNWFRYFLFCIIVPLFVGLILMWIREIVRFRRRRSFIRRARNMVNGILASIRGKVSERINITDLERIVTAAVLVGIKKYADSHPNLRHHVNHVMDVANGEAEIDIMSTEDEITPIKKRKPVAKNKTKKK
ncbi:MAG: hypothetical protein ACLRFK_03625 [Alphaproteobacteria bacterium]